MKKKMLLMVTILIMILLTWAVVTYAAPRAYVTYSDEQAGSVDVRVYFDDTGGFTKVQYATGMTASGNDLNWGSDMTVNGSNPNKYVDIDNATKYMNYYVRIANASVTDAAYVRVFPVTTGAQREFNDYAHGNFRPDTPMCGGCHSTHSALKAQLLKKASYYELCMLCHSNANSQSKYDVERGKTTVSGSSVDSLAGPISNTFGAISIHNADDTSGLTLRDVPGSDLTRDLSLTCVSCHNGHGGTYDNYRLLKRTIYASDDKLTTGQYVYYDAFAITANATSGETVSMVRGNTEFCAACHLDFDNGNAWTKGGQYNPVYGSVYMHPVSVGSVVYSVYYNYVTNAARNPSLAPTAGDVLPLQYNTKTDVGTDKRTAVVCGTCHFAHGSTKSFNVQSAVYDGKYMLRLDNYGVCESCHKK